MMIETTELCPYCNNEADVKYDPKDDRYEAECNHCGRTIMLCDKCLNNGDNQSMFCDWHDKRGCFRSKNRQTFKNLVDFEKCDMYFLKDIETGDIDGVLFVPSDFDSKEKAQEFIDTVKGMAEEDDFSRSITEYIPENLPEGWFFNENIGNDNRIYY